MAKRGFGVTTALVVALTGMLTACDDPEPADPRSLTIIVPQNGAEINFSADTNEVLEGLNQDVLVYAHNFDEGDLITLTAGENEATVGFTVNPVTFSDFTLGTEPGEVSIQATAGAVLSEAIAVTLVEQGTQCPTLHFTSPRADSTLNEEDDENTSTEGFQYTIEASTDAGDGMTMLLYVDGSASGQSATVAGTLAEFSQIDLAEGAHTYEVRIQDAEEGCTGPQVTITVDTGAPTCDISDPGSLVEILNISEDDNEALPGMQVDVTVDTESDTSVDVSLMVDSVTASETTAVAGEAEFEGVGLQEGDRVLQARCEDAAGNVGMSAPRAFLVDTRAPDLNITSPSEGAYIRADDLPDLEGTQFQVCVTSNSDDVEGQQLCGAISGSDPLDTWGCAEIDSSTACVYVEALAGNLLFEVAVTDTSGNEGTAQRTVFVDTDEPRVEIGDPTAAQVLNMYDGAEETPGRQHNVIACASEAGEGTLRANGVPITGAMDIVAVEQSCTASVELPYTLTFSGVTIPEGSQTLTVVFVDAAENEATSPEVTVTVDTVPPTITFTRPRCNSSISDLDMPIDPQLVVSSTATLYFSNDAEPTFSYEEEAEAFGGLAFFPEVSLPVGDNDMWASSTDLAGNATTTTPCTITVGRMYTIEITSPDDGQTMGIDDDVDASGGYAVPICVSSGNLPNTDVTVTVDGSNSSTFSFTGPSSCSQVQLDTDAEPQTIRVSVDVDGGGEDASDEVSVTVDLDQPEGPTDVTAAVDNRRESSLEVSWTPSGDADVGSYNVCWSYVEITNDTIFEEAVDAGNCTVVSESETSATLHGLVIERDYFVGVRAVDEGGNNSDAEGSTSSVRPQFEAATTVDGTAYGYYMGATPPARAGDVNHDGFDDLVVGGTGFGFVFFGPLEDTWTPDVTISSAGNDWHATTGVDFDGNGLSEVVIGDYVSDKVYLFYDRADWSGVTTAANADVTISISTLGVGFGWTVAAAGDFCGSPTGGDSFMDLAIAAPWARAEGEVFIICGTDQDLPAEVDIADGSLTVVRIAGVDATSQTSFANLTMTTMGDLNNDGRDELVIDNAFAEEDGDNPGKVHVVRGLAPSDISALPEVDGIPTLLIGDSTYVQTLVGERNGDEFGIGIGAPGDLNNDGRPDLAVGAPRVGADVGRVYVYLSDSETGWLNTNFARINPVSSGSLFGYSMAAGGAATGSEPRDHGLGSAGSAFGDLVMGYGDATGIACLLGGEGVVSPGDTLTTDDLATDLGFVFDDRAGEDAYYWMSFAGDLNDDGYEDLAITDTDINGWAGRVAIYY